jgi:ribosomal protein S12 methylthiotransferase
MEVQSEISYELNQNKVGKKMKVLVDRVESGNYVARTEYDSPEVDNEVLIPQQDDQYLRIGDFAMVEITSADPYDLYAKPVI